MRKMKRGKIVVTGGLGYIGAHVCVALSDAGFRPVIVDNMCASRPWVAERITKLTGVSTPVYASDCRDQLALRTVFRDEGPIEGVVHLAAFKNVGASVKSPMSYYDNNLRSMMSVLEVMRSAKVTRLVFSSSCTVYGQPEKVPVTESTPLRRAESPYGRTKQVCEDMITDAVASGQELRCTTLRYFNPIGAHPSGLIGELPIGTPQTLVPYITQVAAGLRKELTVFGDDYPTRDGTCIRDYIHVVDLARAHVQAMSWLTQLVGSFNDVFNLGTGRGVSVLEAIKAFAQATGISINYTVGPRRPGDAVEVYADPGRASVNLGWASELGMVDAMRDAWLWQQGLGPVHQ
jgi:UDP-glucose 4-epimerase